MSSVKIDQDELPEHYSIFTLTAVVISADGDGDLVTLAAPGHHPKWLSTRELKLTKSRLQAMDRPWFLACSFHSTTHGGGLGWVDCCFLNGLVMRRLF